MDMGDGHLIAAIRGDKSFYTSDNTFMAVGGVGSVYLAYSHDSGLCWSKPVDTGLIGQPANLILLKDKRLVLTYGQRVKPYGVMACISDNRGKSWSKPIMISDEFELWDCGYPSSIELIDNKIMSVYYGANAENIRGVYYTIWEP